MWPSDRVLWVGQGIKINPGQTHNGGGMSRCLKEIFIKEAMEEVKNTSIMYPALRDLAMKDIVNRANELKCNCDLCVKKGMRDE